MGLAAERGAQPLVPSDLLLLTNFVAAHDSFRLVRASSPKPYPDPVPYMQRRLSWQHMISTIILNACFDLLQRSILVWVTVRAQMPSCVCTTNAVLVPCSHAQTESMSPICLPQFNPAAFLHAYIHYLDQVFPTPCPSHPASLSCVGRCSRQLHA